ncbi:MAG: hypothetical protein MUD12_07450 [Spirochaetes bacterium]|nr:hypothetical protein [Spirochaetota bacterium]
MAEDKNFLQNIKLEISRSFKLVPYERIAFHKVLGILKSDIGKNILVNEIQKGPDIRRSAVSVLVKFNDPDLIRILAPILKKDISESERIQVLGFIEKYGTQENVPEIVDFIETHRNNPEAIPGITKAFEVIRVIGRDSDKVRTYLQTLIGSGEADVNVKSLAVQAISSFKPVHLFEELLKKNDDSISYAVFMSLSLLINELADKMELSRTEDDKLFTYSPDKEDKIVLDIRVLLGKVAPRFDSYSNNTKTALITAMLLCNHREFLIYTMKSLTSGNVELIGMVLYAIYTNINRLRDPDKLFRNLIALTVESPRDSDIIVDILVKFFSSTESSRQFHILQDKLYSYIVVTLETYFETYRRDFMITDVIEKSYPESFQRIRNFILEYCTPSLKKDIVVFLQQEDPAVYKHVVSDMSRWITHIREEDENDLALLIEVLHDEDKKSRENSASRLDDINFEKRYLKNRILRLCRIIEGLNIQEASSPLVNIYNYLKKYPDEKIMAAVIHCLSTLNYSYMLGEIEVMIGTGSEEEQFRGLSYLSLFTEQRSLNILLEMLKKNIAGILPIIEKTVEILLLRDVSGNITAAQIFKGIIENSPSQRIRGLAILGLGKCGFDSDIDYLNELFNKMERDEYKDYIIRAIGEIISINTTVNRRTLNRYLQDYLKDPGIRVRIYSCLLLAKIGNRDALRSIRDMLVIKNKGIQRDILTILGDLRSIEFSFFLLSLLKEEYGISRDIIPILEKLPEEEMKEIDGFIINIFRKYEAPDIEGMGPLNPEEGAIALAGLSETPRTLLRISMLEGGHDPRTSAISELIDVNIAIKAVIINPIAVNEGIIARMSNGEIISSFTDPVAAARVAADILRNTEEYNRTRISSNRIRYFLQIITDSVKMVNEEIMEMSDFKVLDFYDIPISNRIFLDRATSDAVKSLFSIKAVPEAVITNTSKSRDVVEMLDPINFSELADSFDLSISEREKQKEVLNRQLEAEIKKLKRESRSASTAAIARELDNIGRKIESQLDEIEKYVQKRSTDRELIKNVKKMVTNINNLYKVEISRIIVD